MCSVGGSKTLEPRTWNQIGRAQVSWMPWSFRTSYSSEFEAAEHHGREDAADAAMRHGLPARKSLASENPKSGSGPSVPARPEGEQAVEGVRNPEDGRCQARQAWNIRISPLMSLKGRETPGGASRSGMTGEGALARTLRGRRSLWELPGGLRTARTVERRNTSWSYKRRGGGGEPMSLLRRAERSERPVNPARVVRGTATSRGTAEVLPKPLEGPRRTYLSQPPAKKARRTARFGGPSGFRGPSRHLRSGACTPCGAQRREGTMVPAVWRRTRMGP